MTKLLLLTGPGGDAQGWGNMQVTEHLCGVIKSLGIECVIEYISNFQEFVQAIDKNHPDIVWSSLYYITDREDIVALQKDVQWVADLLDERNIPYIGPNAATMKTLIRKFDTHRQMEAFGVAVPHHCLVAPGEVVPECQLPAFVKPNGESRSIGINNNSVCQSREELLKQVAFIHQELNGDALIEDYLPGDEYTVLMLGNGDYQEILPGKVTVSEEHYGKYRILRADLRGVGLTHVSIPAEHAAEAIELARRAADATGCLDHVRMDMRVGADGHLRVIEINGIPGLKPVKSWSPQIWSLYHPEADHDKEYQSMIGAILRSAFARYNIRL